MSSFLSSTISQTAAPSTSSELVSHSSTPTSISAIDGAEQVSYMSSTATGLAACLSVTISLMYLVALSWAWRRARENPRPLNKTSGIYVWTWAPIVYLFLFLTSLAEISLASWLVLQYSFNHNGPGKAALIAIRLILFTSVWTTITAGAYAILFLHPSWSKHPISSIGAQAIWIFISWLFWIIGSALLNSAVGSRLDQGLCDHLVYCDQVKTLLAICIITSVTLSTGMLVLAWLVWQSAQSVLQSPSFQLKDTASSRSSLPS